MRERGRIAWDLGNFLLVNYLSLLVICLKWIRLSHTNFGLTDPSIPLATRLSPSAIRLSNQIGLVNRKLDSSTANWTRQPQIGLVTSDTMLVNLKVSL